VSGNLLVMSDLGPDEVTAILDLAEAASPRRVLEGAGAALVFEKPSARTRNAAEMAVVRLGGHPVTIRGEEVGFDERESVEDVAMTLSSYHRLIGARVGSHSTLERIAASIAAHGREVPTVNLLSDLEHPSQALADLLTIRQCFGKIEGRSVAFIGDGNNVARSLAYGCALQGAAFRIASPEGYALGEADVAGVRALGGEIELFERPVDAAAGADVLYTDVWISMGEESDAARKRAAFGGYTIDEHLLEDAADDAIVLHCLPAHRGEEIAAEVIDGPRSRIWLQAENRMPALVGAFAHLLGGGR